MFWRRRRSRNASEQMLTPFERVINPEGLRANALDSRSREVAHSGAPGFGRDVGVGEA